MPSNSLDNRSLVASYSAVAEKLVGLSRTFQVQLVRGSTLDGFSFLSGALKAAAVSRGSELAQIEVATTPLKMFPDVPFVVCEHFEALLDNATPSRQMANLRSRAMEYVGRGGKVFLLCGVDLSRFADVDGSSLLVDARHFTINRAARRLRGVQLINDTTYSTMPPGFRQLASATGLLGFAEVQETRWHLQLRTAVRSSVRGLGCESSADLLEAIEELLDIEQSYSVAEREDPAADAILDAFSVLHESGSPEALQLHRVISEEVNSNPALSDQTARAFAALWDLERTIRQVVIRACLSQQCRPADLMRENILSRVGERAARAQQHRIAVSVPNPLEWLTLDELLDVVASKEWIGSDLHAFRSQLEVLRHDVLPARNALAHFRSATVVQFKQLTVWRSRLHRMTRDAWGMPS